MSPQLTLEAVDWHLDAAETRKADPGSITEQFSSKWIIFMDHSLISRLLQNLDLIKKPV